eukprot:TRINITY_DN107781_c0_g1_i1.p1 TRINITY_DN107781_c0_g1~~TRINITY_DN107781_c0_g1_i1.p1  ORF type:complete len:480 (-),score=110.99 TRINITY_DN107781_c0_g1_i1:49-1488(-)
MQEDDLPASATWGSEWLREEDAALQQEDAEANAEQAERNAAMRSMLKRRREARPAEPTAAAPEDFMAVSSSVSAPSKRVVDEGQPPWFVMRPHIENAVLRLHEEIIDFVSFMSHTKEEVAARRNWVKTIAAACRALWPGCQVRVFGSFFTGLSLPNGDVDVAIFDVPCKTTTAMKMLADYLLSKGEISWLEIIETAKVPVVKVRSQACGLRADVVFNQPDGIDTSKFIKASLKEHPQMKPLLLFLKYFLLQRGLHETYTGGMGSYLLCNVVLHFLQRHPSRRNPRQYAATSLGHLLFDFLKYYGQEFNYGSQGISVLDGGCTFNKVERGFPQNNRKGGGLQLCLESPLMPSADLGGAAFRMPVLRNLFHHGFHCLCHLFVARSPPEVSMICPLLLDPAHPVITDRFSLMSEQPVALAGLPRAAAQGETQEDQPAADDAPQETPPAKKRRRKAGGEPAADPAEAEQSNAWHEDVLSWEDL